MNHKQTLEQIIKESESIYKNSPKIAIGSGKPDMYIPVYEELFKDIQDKKLNLLEIGVREGTSHLLWEKYFKNSTIYGLDIGTTNCFMKSLETHYPNNRIIDNLNKQKIYNFGRIKVIVGDQTDGELINNNISCDLDIIIDDGGHKMSQQQLSLKYLFKKLKPGGIYIIEDLGTCNPDKKENRLDNRWIDVPDLKFTTVNFLKNIHKENIDSFFIKGKDLNYIQDRIESVEFPVKHPKTGSHEHFAVIKKKK